MKAIIAIGKSKWWKNELYNKEKIPPKSENPLIKNNNPIKKIKKPWYLLTDFLVNMNGYKLIIIEDIPKILYRLLAATLWTDR